MLQSWHRYLAGKWTLCVMTNNRNVDLAPWLKWALGGALALLFGTFKLQYDTWTTFMRDLQVLQHEQAAKVDTLNNTILDYMRMDDTRQARVEADVHSLKTQVAELKGRHP